MDTFCQYMITPVFKLRALTDSFFPANRLLYPLLVDPR